MHFRDVNLWIILIEELQRTFFILRRKSIYKSVPALHNFILWLVLALFIFADICSTLLDLFWIDPYFEERRDSMRKLAAFLSLVAVFLHSIIYFAVCLWFERNLKVSQKAKNAPDYRTRSIIATLVRNSFTVGDKLRKYWSLDTGLWWLREMNPPKVPKRGMQIFW